MGYYSTTLGWAYYTTVGWAYFTTVDWAYHIVQWTEPTVLYYGGLGQLLYYCGLSLLYIQYSIYWAGLGLYNYKLQRTGPTKLQWAGPTKTTAVNYTTVQWAGPIR